MGEDERAPAPGLTRTVQVVAFGIFLAVFVLGLVAVLYPYQTSYVEGYLLEQGARLADGGALYRPIDTAPWIVDNFPPLYPLAMSLGVLLFGVDAGLGFGRALTLLAIAGTALLAYRWQRRMSHPAWLAVGVVALWLASPHVIRRALLVRMDFAGILLSMAALYAYHRLHRRRPVAAPIVAALLSAAALGIRQTLVAAPLALLLTLLLVGRRRDAARYGGTLVGIGLVAVLALQWWSDGGFLRHTLSYNTGRYLFDHYLIRSSRAFVLQGILLIAGAIGAVSYWRSSDAEHRSLALWLVFSAALSTTAGKPGSTYNHFLEVYTAAMMTASAGMVAAVDWAARRIPDGAARARHHLLPLLVLGVLVVQVVIAAASAPVDTGRSALQHDEADAAIVAALEHAPGPVLSENAGAVVLSGHTLLLEPRTLLELHLVDRWDQAPLVANLTAAEYSVLVLETFPPGHLCTLGCRFSNEAWNAITTHYRHDATHGRWQVWRPIGEA